MAGETMIVSIESLATMQAKRVLRERQRIAEEIRDEAAINLAAGKTEYALLLDRLAERIVGAAQTPAVVVAAPAPLVTDDGPSDPQPAYELPQVHLNDDETDIGGVIGRMNAVTRLGGQGFGTGMRD